MNDFKEKIKLEDIFTAYYDCRKNKRNTLSALDFEIDYTTKLTALWREINEGSYKIGKSIAFIVKYPVKREVFAANFRDRIIHHLIIGKMLPYFEKLFIDNSFSCRIGKGNLNGILKTAEFIKECSNNYTENAYIARLDIQSFFMSIDKHILLDKTLTLIEEIYPNIDEKELIKKLFEQIILHQPEKNCEIKCNKELWNELPKEKSLFNVGEYKGLPIGNLTSQVLANLYMNDFDHFVTETCGFKNYCRYVDDFIIIHNDKKELLELIPKIEKYLMYNLKLKLHPKKRYFQHYTKGVKFIGGVIKPYRIYISNRTKGNFYLKIKQMCENNAPVEDLVPVVNSYLGILRHYKTFNIRKDVIINFVMDKYKNKIFVENNFLKINLRISK